MPPSQPASPPSRRRRTLRFGAGPEWSFAQLGVTGVATAGVVVYLGALHLAVGGFDGVWWLLALVPVALMPWSGSAAPLALWAVLLIGWFVLTPEGTYSWWALPAAAGAVAAHAAHALSASSPPAGSFTRATVQRWIRHCLVALCAAGAVVVAVAALSSRDLTIGALGLVVGLAGVAAGLAWVRTSPPSSTD
ncbi:hypothetical protein [Humibacillus xanthopallidus]|uniref:Uncharacterized protein n=1 Tax=Humibacillus xanthopallidus TaxID=412689 RepID=A0A543HJQ9_9MICO|nr:hypothetical protein [Humibacillus xanthopallidus]TQM58565.1 hypothetical protein FBY41_3934 [Humibacillus xanthopallidus]